MSKFSIGDRVRKNPQTWIKSDFERWGAGEGVGVIVDTPFDGECDVRWPAGRCYQFEAELLLAE